MNPTEFGEKARRDLYLLDPNVVYVNHGSYGPCPRLVFDELQRRRTEQEQNPDLWFRITKQCLYIDSLRAAADRLDCQLDQIAVVVNATVGINALLKSPLPTFSSAPGGTILCTNLGYGSVLFTIEEVARQRGMKIRTVDIRLPIQSKEEMIEQFEAELKKGDIDDIRIAVIDHITSSTAILLPIEEITELLQRHKIPVIVDGAHGPGQVSPQLSLKNLKCDFYIGTFHKWMYAPRGCSFLFVRDVNIANMIQPGNTSWGYRPSSDQLKMMTHFQLQFFYQGTRDESPLYILPKAIEFADQCLGGFDRIHQYNSRLSLEAKTLLEQRWNTSGSDLVPNDMQAPYLKMIRLPDLEDYQKSDGDALRLTYVLIEQYRLVAMILFVGNELYVRISAQVYNRIEDYVFLADTIDQLKKKE